MCNSSLKKKFQFKKKKQKMWLRNTKTDVLAWHEPQSPAMQIVVVWIPVTWRTIPISWEQDLWDVDDTEALEPQPPDPKLFHNTK